MRNLNTPNEDPKKLQRYILALALVAMMAPQNYYLREGCHLCRDPSKNPSFSEIHRSGNREPILSIKYEDVLEFAKKVTEEFQVKVDYPPVKFMPEKAREKINEIIESRR